jgi:tetratricopeptide (TPR) repeat protein
MKRVVLLLVLMPGVALGGCSAAGGPPDLVLAQVNTEASPPAPVMGAAASPTAETPFDAESFYTLLVSEMAGREGDYELALRGYLEVARRSRDPAVAERAVRIAVYAGQQDLGLEAAQLWAETARPDHRARQTHALLLARAGRLAQAQEVLVALSQDRAGEDPTLFGRISNMLARDALSTPQRLSREAAVGTMEAVAAAHPESADAQYALAQVLARLGELDKALVAAERVSTLAPDNERGAIFKARVLNRQDRRDDAIAHLQAFLERIPGAHDARMAFARLMVDAKRYDEAREQFLQLSEAQPDNQDVAYALGLLLLQTEDLALARAQFEKLVTSPERRDTAWFYIGQIAEATGSDDEALRAYRKVERGDHRLDAQIRVAVLLAEGGDMPAAREHLHSLRGRSPADAVRLYRAEAQILSQEEMLDDALSVYDKGLEEFPDESGLLYARAMLSVRLDRIDSVEKDLRAILAREPDNADALNALGYTLADRTKRYQEAYDLIRRAFALKPDDHYVADSMGWVLYRLGRYDEAVRHLRRAMELKPDPEVAAHLGEVLWVMGDRDGAREVWNSALEARPEDERLLEVLKRFGD